MILNYLSISNVKPSVYGSHCTFGVHPQQTPGSFSHIKRDDLQSLPKARYLAKDDANKVYFLSMLFPHYTHIHTNTPEAPTADLLVCEAQIFGSSKGAILYPSQLTQPRFVWYCWMEDYKNSYVLYYVHLQKYSNEEINVDRTRFIYRWLLLFDQSGLDLGLCW